MRPGAWRPRLPAFWPHGTPPSGRPPPRRRPGRPPRPVLYTAGTPVGPAGLTELQRRSASSPHRKRGCGDSQAGRWSPSLPPRRSHRGRSRIYSRRAVAGSPLAAGAGARCEAGASGSELLLQAPRDRTWLSHPPATAPPPPPTTSCLRPRPTGVASTRPQPAIEPPPRLLQPPPPLQPAALPPPAATQRSAPASAAE